jgi:hypothetical protein
MIVHLQGFILGVFDFRPLRPRIAAHFPNDILTGLENKQPRLAVTLDL